VSCILVEVDRRFRGAYYEALIIEAVRTSETSVCFNKTTLRYIPEGCRLHTRRRENLKSQSLYAVCLAKTRPSTFSDGACDVRVILRGRSMWHVTCYGFPHVVSRSLLR
jgi:hypothetical protein